MHLLARFYPFAPWSGKASRSSGWNAGYASSKKTGGGGEVLVLDLKERAARHAGFNPPLERARNNVRGVPSIGEDRWCGLAGVTREQLHRDDENRRHIVVHDLRATFVTLALA